MVQVPLFNSCSILPFFSSCRFFSFNFFPFSLSPHLCTDFLLASWPVPQSTLDGLSRRLLDRRTEPRPAVRGLPVVAGYSCVPSLKAGIAMTKDRDGALGNVHAENIGPLQGNLVHQANLPLRELSTDLTSQGACQGSQADCHLLIRPPCLFGSHQGSLSWACVFPPLHAWHVLKPLPQWTSKSC